MARERVEVPEFTRIEQGEASENRMDEENILGDQDQTLNGSSLSDDENMGAKARSLDSLEEEPDEFLQGDIDVKEQMDRAADAMDTSLRGLQSQGNEDSPRTELGASFKHTPGGIEEVAAKTDEYLASHAKPKKKKAEKASAQPAAETQKQANQPSLENLELDEDFDEPKMTGHEQIH